jgi:predicted ATPase
LPEGLAAIDAALTRAEQGGDRCFIAELLRAKAGLLLLQNGPDGVAAARDLLRAAAELAHSQGALYFERRAAMSLARVEARGSPGAGAWPAQILA